MDFKRSTSLWLMGTLLLAYAVLFYAANNSNSFPLLSTFISFLMIFVLYATLLTTLFFICIKFFHISKEITYKVFSGILFLLFLVCMRHSIFSNPDLHYISYLNTTSIFTQWLLYFVFAVIFFGFGFLLNKKGSTGVIVLLLVLSSFNLVQMLKPTLSAFMKEHEKNNLPARVELKDKKNIYFILTDSLTSIPGLKALGIQENNQPFLDQLSAKDFTFYPNFFTSLQPTTYALFSYFNLNYKSNGRNGYLLPIDFLSKQILNDGEMYRILNSQGYKINIFHELNMLNIANCIITHCAIPDDVSLKSKVLTQFSFLALPVFSTYIKHHTNNLFFDPKDQLSHHLENFIEWTQIQLNNLTLDEPNFTYIHAYSFPTHSVPDQTMDHCNEAANIRKYNQRIQITWRFLEKTIQTIQNKDKKALIIIAGDHGPYIFRKCTRAGITKKEDIIERQGAFLAIRWGDDYQGQYDSSIKSSHNLFRYVLSFVLQDEVYLLNAEKDNAYTYYPNGNRIARTIHNGQLQDVFN